MSPGTLFAITFTGNVVRDFPAEACSKDPKGKSVGIPLTFPPNTISGWDIEQICLLYDKPSNTLFVAAKTFDDPVTRLPIIFGDADGDGDPGRTSPAFAAQGGVDYPNLSEKEYFSFVLDFDATPTIFLGKTPKVIAGISAGRSAPGGFRVSEVALPLRDVDFSSGSDYYGKVIDTSLKSALFASPSASAPHLEFTITGFSLLSGFAGLKLTDPNQKIGLVFKAGSLGNVGIGEEKISLFPLLKDFFDDDGDGLPNNADLDGDNDGIPDITEQNLDIFDKNKDCRLSVDEVKASGLDKNGDGVINEADGYVFPDTDKDGMPDYLDTDSDNDTILDIDESNTFLFDTNGDRTISPSEFLKIEVKKIFPGGDSTNCLHNKDLPDTDHDGIPDYRDLDSDNDSLADRIEAGDDDPKTPPVDTSGTKVPDYRNPLVPKISAPPEASTPAVGETIQVQGSGLGGCGLIPKPAICCVARSGHSLRRTTTSTSQSDPLGRLASHPVLK